MVRIVDLGILLEGFYIALCMWVLAIWIYSAYKAAIARRLAHSVLVSIDKSVGQCPNSGAQGGRNVAQLLSELDRLMQDRPDRTVADLNRLALALAAAHLLRRSEHIEPDVFEATVTDLPKSERDHIQQNSPEITSREALEKYIDVQKTGPHKVSYLSSHLGVNLDDLMEQYSHEYDDAA